MQIVTKGKGLVPWSRTQAICVVDDADNGLALKFDFDKGTGQIVCALTEIEVGHLIAMLVGKSSEKTKKYLERNNYKIEKLN